MNFLRMASSIGYIPLILAVSLMSNQLNKPIADPDFFWHLRAGQWMLEHGKIATTDPFSFSLGGHAWISHEWLFEIIIAAFYQLGDLGGVVFLGHLLFLIFIFLLYRLFNSVVPNTSVLTKATLILLVTIGLLPFWTIRPQLFSYIFFVLFLIILEKPSLQYYHIGLLTLVTIVWANSHASYILAPCLIIFRAIFSYWLSLSPDNKNFNSFINPKRIYKGTPKFWLWALLLVIAAAMINPWGPGHFLYPFVVTGDATMLDAINEWHSPNFHDFYERYILSLWILGFLVALVIGSKKLRLDILVLGGGFFWLTLTSIRYTPYWLITVAILILSAIAIHSGKQQQNPTLARKKTLDLALWTIALVLLFSTYRTFPLGTLEQHINPKYPIKAAQILAKIPAGEPLLNNYNWGGFLIWSLPSDHRVFIDGRADLYAGKVFNQYLQLKSLDNPQQVLDEWKFKWIIMPTKEPLTAWLMLHPDWQIHYQDDKAIIFKYIK